MIKLTQKQTALNDQNKADMKQGNADTKHVKADRMGFFALWPQFWHDFFQRRPEM
jgi:hypothetical protein